MLHILKAGLFVLVAVSLPSCTSLDRHPPLKEAPPPPPPDPIQGEPLYTNMLTYGQFTGCSDAQKNIGEPQTGWKQAPSLPGTYEEYLSGWKAGFNKCRIGLGPAVPPDGVYP